MRLMRTRCDVMCVFVRIFLYRSQQSRGTSTMFFFFCVRYFLPILSSSLLTCSLCFFFFLGGLSFCIWPLVMLFTCRPYFFFRLFQFLLDIIFVFRFVSYEIFFFLFLEGNLLFLRNMHERKEKNKKLCVYLVIIFKCCKIFKKMKGVVLLFYALFIWVFGKRGKYCLCN